MYRTFHSSASFDRSETNGGSAREEQWGNTAMGSTSGDAFRRRPSLIERRLPEQDKAQQIAANSCKRGPTQLTNSMFYRALRRLSRPASRLNRTHDLLSAPGNVN
jgi:hypothetical protein